MKVLFFIGALLGALFGRVGYLYLEARSAYVRRSRRVAGSMGVDPNGSESQAVWSLTVVGAMLLLDLAGHFADLRFGTSPWFLLGGYALGLCVLLYAVLHRHSSRQSPSSLHAGSRLGLILLRRTGTVTMDPTSLTSRSSPTTVCNLLNGRRQ